MQTLEPLYDLAVALSQKWQDGSMTRPEACKLIEGCQAIPADLLGSMPDIISMIEYSKNKTWSADIVAGWPGIVINELEVSDKTYHYRPDGENWTVYSLKLTGEEEWKATVETECLAIRNVSLLSGAQLQS